MGARAGRYPVAAQQAGPADRCRRPGGAGRVHGRRAGAEGGGMSVALEGLGLSAGGKPVLHPVSMELPAGLPNVLLGPTGAGKTTLLRLLAGLDRPSEGRLIAEGRDVTGQPVRKRSVAMVYQQFINYPAFTVFENIASPLRVARLPKAEIQSRVQEAAKLLRLTPYLARKPLELSGGQQQRT